MSTIQTDAHVSNQEDLITRFYQLVEDYKKGIFREEEVEENLSIIRDEADKSTYMYCLELWMGACS